MGQLSRDDRVAIGLHMRLSYSAIGAITGRGGLIAFMFCIIDGLLVEVSLKAGRLRDWGGDTGGGSPRTPSGWPPPCGRRLTAAGGEDREMLVQSQRRFGRDDQREAGQMIDGFAAACRKVLHPAEVEGFSWRTRRR